MPFLSNEALGGAKPLPRYLSVITNFGCRHHCPYCITRDRGVEVSRANSLIGLREAIKEISPDIISVSGGGDPFNDYGEHRDWWDDLYRIAGPIPIEPHTSYLENDFDRPCLRIVYHPISKNEDISAIKRKGEEIVRVVYVVTDDMSASDLPSIADEVGESEDIDELSFRQLVKADGSVSRHLGEELAAGHSKGLWHYIRQADYNAYFANGRLCGAFQDIGKDREGGR